MAHPFRGIVVVAGTPVADADAEAPAEPFSGGEPFSGFGMMGLDYGEREGRRASHLVPARYTPVSRILPPFNRQMHAKTFNQLTVARIGAE